MSIDAFECAGSHPSSERAFDTSKKSDSPYSIQWYGAKGARPAVASALIASLAGPTGNDRTTETVQALVN